MMIFYMKKGKKVNMENNWIKVSSKRVDSKYKLICIPYAGSGSNIFYKWQKVIGKDVEILPVQLPGREKRITEECMTDCEKVVEGIAGQLINLIDDHEFAIFGHSMGGIIAYELCRQLQKKYNISPKICFISASHIDADNEKIYLSKLDDEAFVQKLRQYGGINDEILKYPEFFDVFVKILKNDFRLIENYTISEDDKVIHVPIRNYIGTDDNLMKMEKMNDWREYTDLGYTYRIFNGNHFFISDEANMKEICSDICKYLSK